MKIKRFNEKIENDDFFSHIEKDNEIWISKKDLQKYFAIYLNVIKEFNSNNDKETFFKFGLIKFIKEVKDNIDGTGGNPKNLIDPYDEEDWNE